MIEHKEDSIKAIREKEQEGLAVYSYLLDLDYRLLLLEWGVTE
jgi:hypothetical protein